MRFFLSVLIVVVAFVSFLPCYEPMPDGHYFAERQLGHQHIYIYTVVTSDEHPDEVSHNHYGNGDINSIDESPGYTPPGGIVYLTPLWLRPWASPIVYAPYLYAYRIFATTKVQHYPATVQYVLGACIGLL